MLYQIFIYPIELILEVSYFLFDKIIGNYGLSVIGVSLVVQILTLPLYNIAEKWQNVERNIQKHMSSKVAKIKAVFKGDEQYMILSTYYKQQGYHPLYAMRSTIGLLIQVPFFIAAYNFLSNLELLQGQSFSFIKDLGSPDNLFFIGNFSINWIVNPFSNKFLRDFKFIFNWSHISQRTMNSFRIIPMNIIKQ